MKFLLGVGIACAVLCVLCVGASLGRSQVSAPPMGTIQAVIPGEYMTQEQGSMPIKILLHADVPLFAPAPAPLRGEGAARAPVTLEERIAAHEKTLGLLQASVKHFQDQLKAEKTERARKP